MKSFLKADNTVFDANGNMQYKSNKAFGIRYAFEYSALNHLRKGTITATPLNRAILKTIEFKYDPAGRRIMRKLTDFVDQSKSKTQKFYYDGENILAELDADNNLTASYTHSPLRPDDVLGAKFFNAAIANNLASTAGNVYYLKDHLNTVNEIVNAAGEIAQKMDYSAFGMMRSVKDATGTEVGFAQAPVRSAFTYTGREYEPELGMYYYRARYYDPSTGRFLQVDPDPGRISSPSTVVNKYAYVGGNPISYNDPSGKFLLWFANMTGAFGRDMQRIGIITLAAVAAFYGGAFVAAYLGVSGITGAIVGALTGALVGGITGAIGYSFSHSDPQEGFRLGAAVGLFAGGAGGYLSSSILNVGRFSGITPNQVFGFAKNQASSAASGIGGGSELINAGAEYAHIGSWPIWSTLAGYANLALPYAVAVGEAGAIGYLDQCIGAGDCSSLLPKNVSGSLGLEF